MGAIVAVRPLGPQFDLAQVWVGRVGADELEHGIAWHHVELRAEVRLPLPPLLLARGLLLVLGIFPSRLRQGWRQREWRGFFEQMNHSIAGAKPVVDIDDVCGRRRRRMVGAARSQHAEAAVAAAPTVLAPLLELAEAVELERGCQQPIQLLVCHRHQLLPRERASHRLRGRLRRGHFCCRLVQRSRLLPVALRLFALHLIGRHCLCCTDQCQSTLGGRGEARRGTWSSERSWALTRRAGAAGAWIEQGAQLAAPLGMCAVAGQEAVVPVSVHHLLPVVCACARTTNSDEEF